MMSLLTFLDFFIHNITSIYHFFMTALSAHVVLSVLYSTFPTLSKLTYSTYSVKSTWEEMNLFLWGISNRVFLNLNPVVVTVVITQSLSFLLPQHKRRFFFKALIRGSPYILFQPLHLHFYLLAWYLGKFYTGFSSRCNPWEW